MINEALMRVSCPEDFIKMGFVQEDDGTGDPRGIGWNLRTRNFHVLIDAWFEVKIWRLNPDSDHITIHVTDVSELQAVVDWVAETSVPAKGSRSWDEYVIVILNYIGGKGTSKEVHRIMMESNPEINESRAYDQTRQTLCRLAQKRFIKRAPLGPFKQSGSMYELIPEVQETIQGWRWH